MIEVKLLIWYKSISPTIQSCIQKTIISHVIKTIYDSQESHIVEADTHFTLFFCIKYVPLVCIAHA